MSVLRPEKIDIRASKDQKAAIAGKAKEYGISMTELIIAAVEAYVQTYGKLEDEQVVAVSYGALNEISVYFSTVRSELKDIAYMACKAHNDFTSARYEEAYEVSKVVLSKITEAVEELGTISTALVTISEKSMVKVFSLPFESAGWTIVTGDTRQYQ
jgi:hypothetical protein